MNFETISVIGLGYIGLPTAAVFASRKKKVVGVDINQQTVDIINRGEIHIVEPDLDMVVHATVAGGYLKAVTSPEPADAFLIAVPTPIRENFEPDLSYVIAASQAIAPVLKSGDLVILESTSPVGTTEKMAEWLAELRTDLTFPQNNGEESDIRIAHCPERVLPGRVLQELVHNDRVIGGMTLKCSEQAVSLYKVFVEGACVTTNVRTAEMTKLTENSFRDVNIAFANELSVICDEHGVNVWELIALANRHPRVDILKPGPGVGGHCIAVDPWFLVSNSPDKAKLIRTAREVNDSKPNWVVAKIGEAISEALDKPHIDSISDLTIACYGFKANIDDLRSSPALEIVGKIASIFIGAKVVVFDPYVESIPESLSEGGVQLVDEESARLADVAVYLVGHREFSRDPGNSTSIVVDVCGLLSSH